MLGSKFLEALEYDSFAVSFIPLELSRGHRKITGRWEKAKCRIVNKVLCSLEGGYEFEGSVKEYSF